MQENQLTFKSMKLTQIHENYTIITLVKSLDDNYKCNQ